MSRFCSDYLQLLCRLSEATRRNIRIWLHSYQWLPAWITHRFLCHVPYIHDTNHRSNKLTRVFAYLLQYSLWECSGSKVQDTTKNWISYLTNYCMLSWRASPHASKFNSIIQLAYKEYCAETSIIRRHSSDIYLAKNVPDSKCRLLSNVLACVVKTI